MQKLHRGNPYFASFVALACLIFTGLGCNLADRLKASRDSSPSSDTPSAERPSLDGKPASGKRMYEDGESIAAFISALRSKVGANDPNVLKILVYESYLSIQVQDPNKPENVDSYTFRNGSLGAAVPVKLIGGGKLSDNVFRLSEVNLSALPQLTEEVMGKLKDIEGGSMIGYSIGRGLPFSKDIGISPLVNSTRKSVSAKADKNGKLTKWEVS